MRFVLVILLAMSFQGCAFVAMTAASFVGTVAGNLVSDHLKDSEKEIQHDKP